MAKEVKRAKNKKDPYLEKYFYEVVSRAGNGLKLIGPLEDIYFVNPTNKEFKENAYKYAQVVDGKIVQAFTKNEIYVTEKKI